MNIRFFICALILYGSAACAMSVSGNVKKDPLFKQLSRKDQKYILKLDKKLKKVQKKQALLLKKQTSLLEQIAEVDPGLLLQSRKKLSGYKTPEEILP